MSVLNPERIEILGFQILNASINRPEDFDSELIESFEYETNLELAFNLDEDLIKSTLNVDVQSQSQREQIEAHTFYQLVFIFRYPSLNELIHLGLDGELGADMSLGNAISSISYSTSRGILMARFQGTAFSDFILPVVNPNDLMADKVTNKRR